HDPIAALLLCGAEKAEHVMVGGQWRVKNGIIAGLDIQALMAEHKALAAKLVASA
ncbi:8-oxoguanine deaminase, partial [Vibrio fluvialis]|nr:8-oxoguanine deaminase [Vibrio fluvialis]